jgi:hypothetical protein
MGMGFIREEPETLQLIVSCRTNIHLRCICSGMLYFKINPYFVRVNIY